MRRVVCAAIRAEDGEVLLGIRHYSEDMARQMHERHDGVKFMHRVGVDQGFVDQCGVYMTRQEAYDIASQNGQIINPGIAVAGELYSECLY